MERDNPAGTGEPDRPDPADPFGISSEELARRAGAGDLRALDHLVERYLPPLRRWAAGRLPRWARDLVDTDDMIQDVLIKTFRNVGGFAPQHEGALAAYFRQAVNNRIRDEIRKVKRRPLREDLPEDHRDQGASPLEAAVGSEALRRYEGALGRLAGEDQELVIARIEMGLSYEEIARETGKPSGDAARMAVGRALMRLAREMDHD